VAALTPYLVLTTAVTPLSMRIGSDVGLSPQALELTNGMAGAAYAFGTVAAVQLATHLPPRRLLVVYAACFLTGSILAAGAWTPELFIAGRIAQALFTSLMLIAAVPPLITRWPASRLPWTAVTLNMCIFGAVALGPVLGGVQAHAGGWRPLLWAIAGVGALALLMTLLTYEDDPGSNPDAPWDWVAQALAGSGCAAAFFGASELQTHHISSLRVILPLAGGVALIAALLVQQYLSPDPLMPLRKLARTLPVAGIVIAMGAGAAAVAVVRIAQTSLGGSVGPLHTGTLFWPEFGGAAIAAAVFGLVVRTRWIPVLALAGVALVVAGCAVMGRVTDAGDARVALAAALLGLGVGSAVSPGLFLAGFSVRASSIQPVFAIAELLRGVAAFAVAPIVLYVVRQSAAGPGGGTRTGIVVAASIAGGAAVLALAILLLRGTRLRTPKVEEWLEGEDAALDSPRLGR
jgi:MFS family permease